MPFKSKARKRQYDKQRYQEMRNRLIFLLGGKCVVCGGTTNLQVHHIIPFEKRSRPNSKDYFKPEGKELRCEDHHSHTESWRRGKRRKK